jgi:hypothetical protein
MITMYDYVEILGDIRTIAPQAHVAGGATHNARPGRPNANAKRPSKMLRRLMKQLSRQVREPVPVGEHRLAQEYRLLRAQPVKALRIDKLRRNEEVIERVQAQTDELQLELV